MSAFRNIIARRRPSGPVTPIDDGTGASNEAPTGPVSAGTRLLSSSEMLDSNEAMRPPLHSRPRSRPLIVEEIPRWELEPPRRTIGETVSAQQAETHDFLSAHIGAESAEDAGEPAVETGAASTPAEPEARIWDLTPPSADVEPEAESVGPMASEPDPAPASDPALAAALAAPSPAATPSRGGRVKTRLLGFHSDDVVPDLFAAGQEAPAAASVQCPIGFLAIVDGPGFGTSFALSSGLSTLGRGADQTVVLDFGDDSISRSNHASIAYDEEENTVMIGHGGKSNLVRLNGKPLVSATELATGDRIRIGKTTLMFVALCGGGFSWTAAMKEAGQNG